MVNLNAKALSIKALIEKVSRTPKKTRILHIAEPRSSVLVKASSKPLIKTVICRNEYMIERSLTAQA